MKTRWLLILFLSILILTITACGDDDDDAALIADDDTQPPFDDDAVDDDTLDDDTVDDDSVDDDTIDDDAIDDDAIDDDTTDDDTADDDSVDDDTADDDTEPPACEDYALPQVVGNAQFAALTEASGLAVSLKNPGVLWAHNDSGDGPYLYAMTLTGESLGVVELDGATAIDWEDMAVGPCGDDECLFIGDIGDNGSSRTDCSVYRVIEPVIDPTTPFGAMSLVEWDNLPLSYPDGPRDAEALAAHPDGSVYIFAKYPGGISEMYVFPELTPDVPVTLDYIGDLDTGFGLSLTTAADIHRNGRRLLLRTYVSIAEWRLEAGQPFAEIIDAERRWTPFGVEVQGEAVAYDPANGNYLQISEWNFPPIYRVPCNTVR